MIRETRRPIRPNPFTPMPVDIDIDTVLEVEAWRDVPEKE
jgi:hypothetical protein